MHRDHCAGRGLSGRPGGGLLEGQGRNPGELADRKGVRADDGTGKEGAAPERLETRGQMRPGLVGGGVIEEDILRPAGMSGSLFHKMLVRLVRKEEMGC